MKVDVSKIENYENMTAEEKVEALLGLEIEPQTDNEELIKLRNNLNKANSQAADYKRQLKELQAQNMSDADKAKMEFEETLNNLKAENETLKKAQTIANYKANYLANGYDDALATSTAEALESGDMATVFANQKAFNESMLAKAKETLINNQPGLSKGNPPKGEETDPMVTGFKAALGL